jgi:hypothetical protein
VGGHISRNAFGLVDRIFGFTDRLGLVVNLPAHFRQGGSFCPLVAANQIKLDAGIHVVARELLQGRSVYGGILTGLISLNDVIAPLGGLLGIGSEQPEAKAQQDERHHRP